jgi:hypothetical protein
VGYRPLGHGRAPRADRPPAVRPGRRARVPDQKTGLDAGDLCDVAPTGVIATNSIDDVIAAKPDCVVYMPITYDVDDLCRLLESGINVSTLLEHFHDADALDPDLREPIEAASRRGGASLLSAGTSPGFVTDWRKSLQSVSSGETVVGLACCRRVDRRLVRFYDELGDERLARPEAVSLDMADAYKLATDTKAAPWWSTPAGR